MLKNVPSSATQDIRRVSIYLSKPESVSIIDSDLFSRDDIFKGENGEMEQSTLFHWIPRDFHDL